MATWPSNLPQDLLVEGYTEGPPDVMLRSPMEAGPAKVRRRNTAGVRPVKGNLLLSAAELADLKTFYNDTLLGGSLRFSWVDPSDGVTAVEMRFVEVPSWSMRRLSYLVQMSLEILP